MTAKAVPAALIVAAVTHWFGGRTTRTSLPSGLALAAGAGDLAAVRACSPPSHRCWPGCGGPAPRMRRGFPAARAGSRGAVQCWSPCCSSRWSPRSCLRWMRARVPGLLGGWLAALVAGGIVGIIQAVIAFAGRRWPERRPLACDDRLHHRRRRALLRRLPRLARGRDGDRRRPGSCRPSGTSAAAGCGIRRRDRREPGARAAGSRCGFGGCRHPQSNRLRPGSSGPRATSSPMATATRCCCAA